MTGFPSREERFTTVGSTNDVVHGWLADGTPEVCLAVADEQTTGRGRDGRRWLAPPGDALLLSLGFRPDWLEPDRVWRLAAVVTLAMAGAAETVAGLPAGTIRLKWPNDLVIGAGPDGDVRKLAGVIGETNGLGTIDPRAVVGIGINTDWAANAFPAELARTMTSLREASGARIDGDVLLGAFLVRLEADVTRLRRGRFSEADWADRQLTTGRLIRLETPAGDETVRATGVDGATGALIVRDDASAGGERRLLVGEVTHVRLTDSIAERV